MKTPKVYTAIGLMSGTSLDGVDIALIRTDGRANVEPLRFDTHPYSDDDRAAIRAALGKKTRDAIVERAETAVTQAHLRALTSFGEKADMIGFHGQTITHDPAAAFTWQIGDAALMARETRMDVVADFRSADVKAGGQGAPLLPMYHQARAASLGRPLAVVNIGGVSNVTYLGSGDDILAFDTGPGNAMIDDFIMSKTTHRYDEGGKIALSGTVDQNLLKQWMVHPYFNMAVPKSLDRNDFDVSDAAGLSLADGAATLTAFTIQSIAAALPHLPREPEQWIVTGGGRKNDTIMRGLNDALGVPVRPVESAGWNGDAVEAEGFAYFAVRSMLGLPITLPGTTGVPHPLTGGVLFRP